MKNFSPVVSADWLAQHLDNPQVAIADCRFALASPTVGQQQYETGHIPGAVYFDLNQDLSGPIGQHGGRHPLPDPALLAQNLSAAGIHSGSEAAAQNGDENFGENSATLVVAYDDSRLAFASRFWWLLRYLGHPQVAVLDGGFQAWQAAGYAVTTERPKPKPGHFIPRLQADWVVDIEQVKSRQGLPQIGLVDAREGDRYRGEREPIDPVAGHIPGAVNYPWKDMTDEEGRVRDRASQQQRWADLRRAEEIIVYCGSGVTACVDLLSLELAGIQTGKLYAGSWSDWCSYLGSEILGSEIESESQ